uniref:Uncharacterized protein LOC114347047 n=1 Tax=Diabrotica virgifera virgifera TaxID=50390 RepID=A0A6P7HCR3_DIAVI
NRITLAAENLQVISSKQVSISPSKEKDEHISTRITKDVSQLSPSVSLQTPASFMYNLPRESKLKFDPPHLQKATRNNLINNSFHFDNKKTSWVFVEHFYREDKKQPYRCAPKLTDAHIRPTNFQKLKVKLATEVLSGSVASGMQTYMTLGALPLDAAGTIEVINKFDKLFDIFNSTNICHPNKFKNVFKGLDYQLNYIDDMWTFLDNLKIYKGNKDVTSKSKFLT